MHNHDSSEVIKKDLIINYRRQRKGKWNEVKNQTEKKKNKYINI